MEPFKYTGLPGRVIFGDGTLGQLKEELAHLDCKSAMVITTAFQKDLGQNILSTLGELGAVLYTNAQMHTPVDTTNEAMALVSKNAVDCFIPVGGGSTIGLSKALALRTNLPQIAIPTTYAGSEMTPILGQTEKGLKTTLRDMKVLPDSVIYDVSLTMSLPQTMSGLSGINAIAHAVEALYAEDKNPIISMKATEGIRALYSALSKIMIDPADRGARSDALYGAWLCASCLGSVGMALHHKLCHTVGGTFNLPHAETHAIILPHAIAYNYHTARDAMHKLCDALGSDQPYNALYNLTKSIGAPISLKALGMPESGIQQATDLAMKNQYYNPRPLEADAIKTLLAKAWRGDAPTPD